MSIDKPVRRIAIVGTGVIGASWAALYLARGFDVVATDPGPKAEANLRKYINEAWSDLTAIGLSPGASRDRLIFASSLAGAVADFVLLHVETATWRFNWYVFNLADVAIVAGVVVLLYESLLGDGAAKAP